ncbi:hypothetical protein [Alteromonas sp. W364]|uniref:hypothetical protein n=1 Tax=Alteromonas sp. W364 TaxID=3075610 RepID=UPI002886640B|nr:hypothetical protein [Alteromonas sp. W364]MDT0626886.1 hypothetical protein [Alteromonas sp. W364]
MRIESGNAATQNIDDSICLVTGKSIAKRPPFKLELILLCLLRTGSDGMNQPEASIVYGETCLHSSVSALQHKHGIMINRIPESWPHRHGGKTYFKRYWLATAKDEVKALVLLNQIRSKRGMYPLQLRKYFELPNRAA